MKGTTNAQQNAVVGSSSDGKGKLTLNYADGTHPDTQIVTVDEALSTTSTNPVQNKAVKTAIDGKQAALTDTQMKAVNSGITAEKVTQYDGMVSTGGQPNVIETVKVNNTALPVTGKAVNIDLSGYATTTQVNAKLDTATASSTYATKTEVSAKANSDDVYTKTEADTAIETKVNAKVASVYRFKDSRTYAQLPASGNTIGDVYNVTDAHDNVPAGTNYAWNGTAWDPLGGPVDLSSYAKSADVVPKTVKVNGKALSGDISLTAADVGALASNGKAASATTADSATKATQDGSGNVITSTYATQSTVNTLTTTVGNKMDKSAVVTSLTGSSDTNVPSEKAVYNAINSKMDAKAIDSTPTENSTNLVTSGGVYSAINSLSLGGGGGGATEDASLWIPSNYDLTEIALTLKSGSGWSKFNCTAEQYLNADVLVVKWGSSYTFQDLTHYKVATNETSGFVFVMVATYRGGPEVRHAFLPFVSYDSTNPLGIYVPCSPTGSNFGFATLSVQGGLSTSITDIDNFTIYLGTKKTSSGGTVTPEPTNDWNLDNMVADSYAMRDMDGYRAFGVRGITGSTPVVTKAKVTYDSGGSWEWTVSDNDPNISARYFDGNAWPNSVAGESTRKITLYDADDNVVASKTAFTVEMKSWIGESDWNVDDVVVEIKTNSGAIAPQISITGITGSTPTCTQVRLWKDGDSNKYTYSVSNNKPNISSVTSTAYVSQTLYSLSDRRLDLLNSYGDVLATKIGWEVNRHS